MYIYNITLSLRIRAKLTHGRMCDTVYRYIRLLGDSIYSLRDRSGEGQGRRGIVRRKTSIETCKSHLEACKKKNC